MTNSYAGLLAGEVFLGLSIAAPIGPVNIAMVQRGLREGFAGAFLLGVGSTVADLIYIILAYAGADPLSHLAWARTLLFAAGALVMTWLGYGAIRAALADRVGPADPGGAAAATPAARPAFVSGFLITIVNPMTIAFWLGILSASLAARSCAPMAIELLYTGSLVAGCLLWIVGLSVALHFGRRVAGDGLLRAVSMTAGLALVGFGAHFGLKAIREVM